MATEDTSRLWEDKQGEAVSEEISRVVAGIR